MSRKYLVYKIIAIIITLLLVCVFIWSIPPSPGPLIKEIRSNWNIDIPMPEHTGYEKDKRFIEGIQYEIFDYKNSSDIDDFCNWANNEEKEELFREAEGYLKEIKVPRYRWPKVENLLAYRNKNGDDEIYIFMSSEKARVYVLEIYR